MAVPKKPQDHKPKKSDTFEYNGETYTVSEDALDDVELMEDIESERFISVIRRLISPEDWTRFKDSNRNEAGRVSVEEHLQPFVSALFDQVAAAKN